MTLLGCCANPEGEGYYTDSPETALTQQLPEDITAEYFAEELLGLTT